MQDLGDTETGEILTIPVASTEPEANPSLAAKKKIAEPTTASPQPKPADEIEADISEHEINMAFGDRQYRIRGLQKNISFEVLKVNVLVRRNEASDVQGCTNVAGAGSAGAYHVDALELYKEVFWNYRKIPQSGDVPHLTYLSLVTIPFGFVQKTLGGYKEVELSLNVSVNEKFGQKEHEGLFRPPRMEMKDFPSYCRMDLFLNEELSVARIIEGGEGQQLLTGLVLENGRGDRLGIFVDEDIPVNLILTTDDKSIDKLC